MHTSDSDKVIRPTCPGCGSHEVAELVSTRVEYPVAAIGGGEAETMAGRTVADGDFDGFGCRICFYESNEIADFVAPDPDFDPEYETWRHGGWYVHSVRHKNGGIGCVSRDYPDRKWRIVCDSRDGDHTYKSRDEAARAEHALTRAGVIE